MNWSFMCQSQVSKLGLVKLMFLLCGSVQDGLIDKGKEYSFLKFAKIAVYIVQYKYN